MRIFNRFSDVADIALHSFPHRPVQPTKWQGVDVATRPEMAMHEALFFSFRVNLWTEDLAELAEDIKPNLPWADNHFAERVSGYPLNPGTEWKNWPYAKSAEKFLDLDGDRFNHNYMERYWPKYAGVYNKPVYTVSDLTVDGKAYWQLDDLAPQEGIRHEYGDLAGLVRLLAEEPDTRQGYLTVWFPEDNGDSHQGLKPCTLGYHFIIRNEMLHCVYYIRSCDYVRHFRDDIYLTVRLQLWIIRALRAMEKFENLKPGTFAMHITSLHLFRNDYLALKG